jgi:radical SAM superfamily enzyme with C-terminal helix-hairpin-helix motif
MSYATCPDWPDLMEIAPDLQFKHYTARDAQLPAEALMTIPGLNLDEVEICCDLDRHVYYARHTDPRVVEANNLNSTAGQVMDAIRIINEEGGRVGTSGLPDLLPGLNFIIGLEGETARTLELDLAFLKEVLSSGYLLRRINVRQVIPIRREFAPTVGHGEFLRFKDRVREDIDRPMLERLVPQGRVLRRVFTELRDGSTTFGRQIGSYPLLIGIPYPVDLGKLVDVQVVGWGYRSITAIEHPLNINTCSLKALEALPGVGRKRAIRLFRPQGYGPSRSEPFQRVLYRFAYPACAGVYPAGCR